jgi:hypothetical protein
MHGEEFSYSEQLSWVKYFMKRLCDIEEGRRAVLFY